MEQYKKPEYHFIHNSGGLSGDEIAKLTDEELAEYLHKCNFTEEKKKYRMLMHIYMDSRKMALMNLLAGQKQGCKHRKWSCGYSGGRRGWDKSRE